MQNLLPVISLAERVGPKMTGVDVVDISTASDAFNAYRAMVYSDLLRTLRYGNDWLRLTQSDAYYAAYSRVTTLILSQLETRVRLALLNDDSDVCIGWCLTTGDTLHYVYVKKDFRRQGVGNLIMPKACAKISNMTKSGLAIWNAKYPQTPFNPFF